MGALRPAPLWPTAYTPEEGIHLDTLRHDIKFLRRLLQVDECSKAEGRLVNGNEAASTVDMIDAISFMFTEEGETLFDAHLAPYGHTLQGSIPSPVGHARAVRLALRHMTFIEEHIEEHHAKLRQPARAPRPECATVISIWGRIWSGRRRKKWQTRWRSVLT